jgi:hypothetical protein
LLLICLGSHAGTYGPPNKWTEWHENIESLPLGKGKATITPQSDTQLRKAEVLGSATRTLCFTGG